jgi:hypothetical protein
VYCSAARAFAELTFLAYEAKAGVMIRHPLYALIRDISPQVPFTSPTMRTTVDLHSNR